MTNDLNPPTEIPRVSAPTYLYESYEVRRTVSHCFLALLDDAYRYEKVRAIIAGAINHCIETGRAAFARCTFDIWLGQRSYQGRFDPVMELILAPRPGARLPANRFQDAFAAEPNYLGARRGIDVIYQGAFPELHVTGGIVAHHWHMPLRFASACSRRYRKLHGLIASTQDPYCQMIRGAEEPVDFEWCGKTLQPVSF